MTDEVSPNPLWQPREERPPFDERCTYCNKRVKLAFGGRAHEHDDATWDHTKPKSMLLHNEKEELVTCCRQCNHIKDDTPLEVFRAYIKLFGYQGLSNHRAYRTFCHELMISGLSNMSDIIDMLLSRWPSLRND